MAGDDGESRARPGVAQHAGDVDGPLVRGAGRPVGVGHRVVEDVAARAVQDEAPLLFTVRQGRQEAGSREVLRLRGSQGRVYGGGAALGRLDGQGRGRVPVGRGPEGPVPRSRVVHGEVPVGPGGNRHCDPADAIHRGDRGPGHCLSTGVHDRALQPRGGAVHRSPACPRPCQSSHGPPRALPSPHPYLPVFEASVPGAQPVVTGGRSSWDRGK